MLDAALTENAQFTNKGAKQLSERTTAFGDKLEIYFDSLAETMPFRVVVNHLTEFPCVSWKEATELYDHFYSKAA
jgi:hypothetical protein